MRAFWKRASGAPGLVSIGLGADGLALAHVTRPAGGLPRLERCELVPQATAAERGAELASCVSRLGLRHSRCVFVLAPEHYALRVIEAPDVEPDELRAAARWSIQDLVDFDVTDAAVDVFDIPNQQPHRTPRMYVVAARPEAIRGCAELARRAELEISAIDIAELALRNLIALHPGDAQGLVTLVLGSDTGLITLGREGVLYVARWVQASAQALESLTEKTDDEVAEWSPGGDEARESLDTLVLELQRSLDYYEHELRQRPARTLLLAPLERDVPPLADQLGRQLGLDVEALDLEALLEVPDPPDRATLVRSLAAIGGALRQEEPAE